MARCTAKCGGWTTRVRRHGGFERIQEKRARQFIRLGSIDRFSRLYGRAQDAIGWLQQHPLRVLNVVEEELFGVATVSA